MPTLLLDVPAPAESSRIELDDGTAILVGREPNVVSLPADTVDASTEVSIAAIKSPSVSGNHVLVIRDGPKVHVRDLGSRNGTWLRVPSHGVATTETDGDVRVRLGGAATSTRTDVEPEDPSYGSLEDYPTAVLSSVLAWLDRRGILARAGLTPSQKPDDWDGVLRFPIASGTTLWIAFDQTIDSVAVRLLEGLRPWFHRNNLAFSSELDSQNEGMILASREIRSAFRTVSDSALRGIPNLVLLGPSGAGKERLAQVFHRHTGRAGPFVAINCAMLDRNLARADLFGADAGAYTGADRVRIGAIERAHGGTIFLDEIGEMPPEVQPFLLRFLDENGEFERMGGDGRLRRSDVRIVCATNRDLREAALTGTFRKDLWWRLSVQVVEVPPLRRRFEDVLAYLRGQRHGALSVFDALEPSALEFLRHHPWDGNFRELTNFVLRLPVASRPQSLDEPTVRRALSAGALSPLRPACTDALHAPGGATEWEETTRIAAQAYSEDHPQSEPSTWSDISIFIEQYLKPVMLQRIVGRLDGADTAREVSHRTQADSKTIAKHLRRYADRFKR